MKGKMQLESSDFYISKGLEAEDSWVPLGIAGLVGYNSIANKFQRMGGKAQEPVLTGNREDE